MSNTPNPMDRKTLTRVGIIGALLGVGGIVLFLVLWVLLGQAGTAQAPRLFASLCVPPLIIGVILGIYVLFFRSRSSS